MKVLLVVELLILLILVVYGWGPDFQTWARRRKRHSRRRARSALGCHFLFLRSGSLHQVSVPHQLEVVAPEPASASLLDKRQPATSTPQVHRYGADPEQFSGWPVSQSCVEHPAARELGLCAVAGGFLARDRSSRPASTSNTGSWSSDARPERPREVSSPRATSFPISDTWQPRISAAEPG